MDLSIFLAKLIGPALLIIGLSALVNRHTYREVAREFIDSPALIVFAGLAALALGLPLVVTHNLWTWNWPVVITLLGWLSLVAGVMRLVVPGVLQTVGRAMASNDGVMIGAGLLYIALGLWLSLAGYLGWGA